MTSERAGCCCRPCRTHTPAAQTNREGVFDARSGVAYAEVGPTAPYFSMLQVIALFIICNAPVALWRFFDCRLTHSPEILPLLVAAQELRRRKASLLVFPGSAREETSGATSRLSDFLATCHLPVALLNEVDARGPPDTASSSFFVLCIDSPAAARAYYAGWMRVRPDQMLLIIDPIVYQTVPELRIIQAVQLVAKPIFLKELMQVMGMKLGRFCHELDKLPKAPVFELEDI